MKKAVAETTWYEALCVPLCYVCGIADGGMDEIYENGVKVNSDDLRMGIELSGGNLLLLPSSKVSRLVMDDEGNIHIEVLKPTNR